MLKVVRPSLATSRRYKILVLGSSGCGKTSAIQKSLHLINNDAAVAAAAPPPPPTLGSELYLKEETFNESVTAPKCSLFTDYSSVAVLLVVF
jgi:GTPase SAR1 family protein